MFPSGSGEGREREYSKENKTEPWTSRCSNSRGWGRLVTHTQRARELQQQRRIAGTWRPYLELRKEAWEVGVEALVMDQQKTKLEICVRAMF